ncbi:MAG: P-loop NTPase [Candidatus Binatia bacterium]
MDALLQSNLTESISPVRVFSLVSGKGGVGKTNVVANLAAALTFTGKRVAVIDGDLGLANLDLLLGVRPRYTLRDFFTGRRALTDTCITSPLGITVFPATSGAPELTRLSHEQKLLFLSELDTLPNDSDIMLVDTASGISDTVTYFASAAHEIVLVITPEPTSLADTSALVNVLASVHGEKRFWVIANTVEDETAAQRLLAALWRTTDRCVHTSFELLGWIPRDPALTHAVMQQRMVVETAPHSPSARAFTDLARRLVETTATTARVKGGLQFFFSGVLAASLEEKR